MEMRKPATIIVVAGFSFDGGLLVKCHVVQIWQQVLAKDGS